MTSVTLSHKKKSRKNGIKNYMELISLSGPLTNTHPPFSIKAFRILIYSWPWKIENYVLLHKI